LTREIIIKLVILWSKFDENYTLVYADQPNKVEMFPKLGLVLLSRKKNDLIQGDEGFTEIKTKSTKCLTLCARSRKEVGLV
jgi:hypothetical protein